jgi:3-dehydroquinate dehydratase/shikimate dehydrogenase
MNHGKICVSVCAETADELIDKIKRAEDSADIIEVRLDCIQWEQIHKTFALLGSRKTLLLTYRPHDQGGKIIAKPSERETFWKAFVIGQNIDAAKCWFDFEYDLPRLPKASNPVTIRSFHDFSGVPQNLENIYDALSVNHEIPKIAVRAEDVTETIPIWKLLKRARSENNPIVAVAMGESGKLTRILGLAHGALMTYAALDAGAETAPGQVSARDLTEVYRARQLDETTEVYGILGSNTSVSMSPYIHNAAFQLHDLNAVFVPLQVRDLDEFMRRMVQSETREIDLNFKGFSVTLPHKQSIIKHLDHLDETAAEIGAVNTVKIIDGKLYGFNTDARGFIEPLLNSYGDLRGARVAVLGAGGAARACLYALGQAGASVTVFARDPAKASGLAEEFEVGLKAFDARHPVPGAYRDYDILVNTTPLGMKGKADGESPAAAGQLKGLNLVYDLVYIPFQTPLMTQADLAEVPKMGGLAMLIAQAAEQQKIWTGLAAPLKEMSRAVLQRLQ